MSNTDSCVTSDREINPLFRGNCHVRNHRGADMRKLIILMLSVASVASAQPTHKFPPDSLTNTQVIPRSTPVIEVVGMMRNFTSALGVRCTFCHVGSEGEDLAEYDFAS